ncbi:phage tail protein [Breznakiella homolactica]|uniref:Phage tail protein n=1 Tax=Breznakiella homolactica TaxID=2798577 RepID=A0A7T7XMI1_9SPIR|nr:phage tail protein [Breznakiella homolactica]QQO09012.1 phage tail protein [Breznakiella homolactica]
MGKQMNTGQEKQRDTTRYVGINLYKARKKILQDFPDMAEADIAVEYTESPHPRLTVLNCRFEPARRTIRLTVSSNNPIRHLPSNYQNNEFLRGFLMIFQHIMNDTAGTLDNLHEYFRPMESPVRFLPVLADWLGIHLDTLGGEDEVRRFLQYAIPLYRYRGTALGLRAHLAIVSGVIPEIIEGSRPYSSMVIHENSGVETSLFEAENEEQCFTIFFPVERSRFDDTLIRRLSLIVQQEKPVHTKAYISFVQPKKEWRKVTTIREENSMDLDGVIFI